MRLIEKEYKVFFQDKTEANLVSFESSPLDILSNTGCGIWILLFGTSLRGLVKVFPLCLFHREDMNIGAASYFKFMGCASERFDIVGHIHLQ